MPLELLVAGTGRCGTVYLARLLTAAGLPCGHESFFDWTGLRAAERRLRGEDRPGLSYASRMRFESGRWVPGDRWLPEGIELRAESSYMAVPFLGEACLAGVPVLHLVRHPLLVANSFLSHLGYFATAKPSNSYEQFIYRHVMGMGEAASPADRACLFYLGWNARIEAARPTRFHRVEDGSSQLLASLGLPAVEVGSRLNALDQRCGNTFRLCKVMDQRLRDDFISLGVRYGYDMRDEIALA